MSFPRSSAGRVIRLQCGRPGFNPGLGRYPGEGNSYLLQHSGLENSMDCIVHGVTESHTPLSNLHFHFSLSTRLHTSVTKLLLMPFPPPRNALPHLCPRKSVTSPLQVSRHPPPLWSAHPSILATVHSSVCAWDCLCFDQIDFFYLISFNTFLVSSPLFF